MEALPADLVFASDREGPRHVYRLTPGSPEATRIGSASFDEVPLASAPDGSALVVGRTVPSDERDWEQLLVLASGETYALTPPTARARNPSWSPDGQWVAFEADLESVSDLYRTSRTGTDRQRLTNNPEGNYEPTVSRDGAAILFVSSRDMNAEAYRMSADGSAPTRLPASPRDEWSVKPSPDGALVAMLSTERGRDELFIAGPDGVGRQRLNASREPLAEEVLEGEPSWSPDGRYLTYTTLARSGTSQIWTVEVESGRHTALTDTTSRNGAPTWSPDGGYIAFVSDRDGDAEIYIMRADGSGPTRLTRSPAADTHPLWMPRAR